jgi:type IV pilus assembly protein PilB
MAGPVKSFGERIADALVEDGLLTAKQVAELLEQQKKEGVRLLKLVTEKGYVGEQDLAVSMGRVLNVPPINLGRASIAPEVSELLPRDVAANYRVCPVSRLENRLFLAMVDPLNVLAIDDVKRITKMDIVPMIASERAITDKLHQIESAKSGTMEDIIQDAEAKAAEEADGLETVKDVVE